ncbi:MAG: CDP-6-deoxy-delta-3,4-glucoseen reductase, partial [Pseudomonadota bacterium]
WGGRRNEDIYMKELAEGWAKAHSHITFIPVLSEPSPSDGWTGRTGFVHQAVMQDFPDMSGMEVYACGSPVVIDSARRDFAANCKLPEAAFYADAFLTTADKAA